MITQADITSWDSQAMDWDNPNPFDVKYYWALQNALAERIGCLVSEIAGQTYPAQAGYVNSIRFESNEIISIEKITTLATEIQDLCGTFVCFDLFKGTTFGSYGDGCFDSLQEDSVPTIAGTQKYDLFDLPKAGSSNIEQLKRWLKTAKSAISDMRYCAVPMVSYNWDGDETTGSVESAVEMHNQSGTRTEYYVDADWKWEDGEWKWQSITPADVWTQHGGTRSPYSIGNITDYNTLNDVDYFPHGHRPKPIYPNIRISGTATVYYDYIDITEIGGDNPTYVLYLETVEGYGSHIYYEFPKYAKPYRAMVSVLNTNQDQWGVCYDQTYHFNPVDIEDLKPLASGFEMNYGINYVSGMTVEKYSGEVAPRIIDANNIVGVSWNFSSWKSILSKMLVDADTKCQELAASYVRPAEHAIDRSSTSRSFEITVAFYGDFGNGFEFIPSETSNI